MPATLTSDLLARSLTADITVAVEPAVNILTTLTLLNKVNRFSGLGEWVNQAAARFTPEQRRRNQLVFEGLYYAVQPERRWPSFPDYLADLEQSDPAILRDRLLWEIARPHMPGNTARAERARPADLLANVETYLAFLREYFCDIDEAIETDTHALLNDPPAMQRLIVAHMRDIWHNGLAAEWARVEPILNESAGAFQRVSLAGKSGLDAMRLIIGQEPDEKWGPLMQETRQIIFVPSAHIGPYLHKSLSRQTLWVIFGARLPEGVPAGTSALSRSDLLVRLSALTDDTRLRILALLSQHDELCAQDIMTLLDLTQSATSRHLRQLSATGYITERRREIAKCYSLNRARVGDTFRALDRFLAQPSS